MISRLAPTPSGFLHWGNFFNFALTWASVRRERGTLWLRIDDVDASRMRPEYVDDVFETLRWLGLDWDQGPQTSAEFFAAYSQRLRREEYWTRVQSLPTYACDCSRQQIQLRQATGGYDGFCRDRGLPFSAGQTALRLKLADFHDPVLWTREDRPAYHLVSVLDDLRMGITHLIRGEDLRESSHLQVRLAEVMGEKAYARIEHRFHPLLLGPDGKKLSKTADSQSLRELRSRGVEPADAWSGLSRRAGFGQKIAVPEALLSLDLSSLWSTF